MPLIFITGISTSGKSTIAAELKNRGYKAYDTEHNGISAWFNKQTGEREAEFGKVPERTPEWLNTHEWLISMDWLDEIVAKSKNEPVFICGGGANEPEVRAKCEKVFWLKTDEKTIRGRVNNPRDHNYGTKAHELTAILEGNALKQTEYESYGAIMIDATRPISKIIDEILAKI